MRIKQTTMVLTASLLAPGLAACGSSTKASSGSNTGTQAVLATVNKTPVTQGQLTQFVNGTQFMQGTTFPTTKKEKVLELKAVVGQVAVDRWVLGHHLTTQKAAAKQARTIIKNNIEARIGGSAALKKLLASKHLTSSSLQSYLTSQMLAESAFQKTSKTVKAPTLKQEQAFYQANKQSFTNPPEDKLSDILVKTSAVAKTVLAKAKAGTPFASLAKKYSISSTSKTGGSLGYKPVSASAMSSGLYAAVQNMKKGQFKTYHGSKGYHVIWLQDTKPATVQPFSKVKSQIASAVTQNLDGQAYQNFVTSLEKKDKITYAKGW